MKTSINGFLTHSLFLMLFVAVGLTPAYAGTAKDCNDPKWGDHPSCAGGGTDPDPGDECAGFAAPDYVFWRDTGKFTGRTNAPAKTVFAAESATGCERELLRIDLSESGPTNRVSLAYSSVGEGDSFFGRIVFHRDEWLDSSQGPSVWKYDFGIEDGQIQPAGGPVMVLLNTDPDNQFGREIDLSADTGSLVWILGLRDGDAMNLSIRTLDIDGCEQWPCAFFDEGNVLVEYADTASMETYLQQPAWGPYRDLIYFVAHERHFEPDLHSHYVRAIASDGSDNGSATNIVGIENQVPGDPDYRHIRSVASGVSGSPELHDYLAVEIGEDNFVYRCAEVYMLDLTECVQQGCELQYALGGNFLSWNRAGALFLTGLGGACKYNQIGIWDDAGLDILTKGYEPEAAGGVAATP